MCGVGYLESPGPVEFPALGNQMDLFASLLLGCPSPWGRGRVSIGRSVALAMGYDVGAGHAAE